MIIPTTSNKGVGHIANTDAKDNKRGKLPSDIAKNQWGLLKST